MRNRLTRLAARVAALALAIGLDAPTAPPADARADAQVGRPWQDAGRPWQQVGRPWQDAGRAALAVEATPFIEALDDPIFITHAGDGSGRLFVVERRGKIKVVVNGQVLATPLLDLSTGNQLTTSDSEQGLLGLAFHPNFRANGRFFVYSTPPPPNPNPDNLRGFNALTEYRVSLPGGNQALPNTKRSLFSLPDRQTNHNGGMIAFGPDGYLYVGIGDEGGSGDPANNAQNPNTLFGKLLRIDVDRADPGLSYAIPPTNPFADRTDVRREIWSSGLRNPWRWSFDRATGDLWIADVGQNQWEEVNLQRAEAGGGQNYGWKVVEGLHCFSPASGCSTSGLTPPVAEYAHGDGNCSVTGGYVYRGSRSPALAGAYLYADYCSGRIWSLRPAGGTWTSTPMLDTSFMIASFGEDESGELYVVHAPFGATTPRGAVYRLVEGTPAAVACSPRPPVTVRTAPSGPGQLRVTVTAGTTAGGAPNTLDALQFGVATNARIAVEGGPERAVGFTQALPAGTHQATFAVHRAGTGAMNVPLKVLDGCGVWPTFVGAGAGAP